jgi:anti-anti-sigma factor
MLPRIHPSSTERSSDSKSGTSLTTIRQDRTRTLVRAEGEWDLANAHVLADALAEHERAGRRFVRLDVSAVTFLDGTCLEVLAAAHVRLLGARGTLVLTGVPARIMRLLNFAGLAQVLFTTSLSDVDVHPDRLIVPRRTSVVRPMVRPA